MDRKLLYYCIAYSSSGAYCNSSISTYYITSNLG